MKDGPSAQQPEKVKLVYQVKAGDTLSSVARLFRTSVQSLKVWNRLGSDRLTPGSRLTVYRVRGNQP
jgi:LysM repeat protein